MRQIDAGCIRCGDCCEFIGCGFTLEKVRSTPDFPDRDFILEHWTPIDPPAKKLNPLMSDKQFDGYIWYKCDLFDSETRKCKVFKNRPETCRGCAPRRDTNKTLMSARCGYFKE